MPAGGETIICGQYTVTYGAVACGIMEGDAGVPTLEQTSKAAPLDSTDKYGKTTIDAVYLGVDWKCMFVCEEYRAGSLSAFYPFGALGLLGVIGRLYYGMSSALVLTAIAGTPATATPATLTAPKAILTIGFPSKLLFGPIIRKVPISLMLLLTDTGSSVYGHFTTT